MHAAEQYAREVHAGQKYGDEDYSVHLEAVVEIAVGVNDPYLPPELVTAVAWLHDAPEDTDATVESVRDLCGWDVSDAVAGLTDPDLPTRKERKQALHARLYRLNGDPAYWVSRAILLVKASDRLANGRASAANSPRKLKMYRQEHAAFRRAAYRPGLCEAVWEELDRLLGE